MFSVAPPVVPPAWVAQPTIPVGGFGFRLCDCEGDGGCDDAPPGELGGWLGPGPAASQLCCIATVLHIRAAYISPGARPAGRSTLLP
jgi:hypothetical protein